MLHFLAIEALLDSDHLALHLRELCRRLLYHRRQEMPLAKR
jgi:hypothetical protein